MKYHACITRRVRVCGDELPLATTKGDGWYAEQHTNQSRGATLRMVNTVVGFRILLGVWVWETI